MKGNRVEYDLAYGCFLFCGLAALLAIIMEATPKGEGSAALLGFFVAIPLVLASFAALVVGIVLSSRLWRHWPLPILSGVSVLFVAALLAGHGSTAFYYVISIIYAGAAVAISGVWFLILRGGMGPPPANPDVPPNKRMQRTIGRIGGTHQDDLPSMPRPS